MTTYFVECFWPAVSRARLSVALDRLDGQPVRLLDTILVPADEIVLCVVEGASEQEISAAAARAGLPSERVVECIQLVPPRTHRPRAHGCTDSPTPQPRSSR